MFCHLRDHDYGNYSRIIGKLTSQLLRDYIKYEQAKVEVIFVLNLSNVFNKKTGASAPVNNLSYIKYITS